MDGCRRLWSIMSCSNCQIQLIASLHSCLAFIRETCALTRVEDEIKKVHYALFRLLCQRCLLSSKYNWCSHRGTGKSSLKHSDGFICTV